VQRSDQLKLKDRDNPVSVKVGDADIARSKKYLPFQSSAITENLKDFFRVILGKS
jgi:hypothetical protein